MVKIIAHRGASNIAPENTLSSFQKALDLHTDAIELDVHQTLDKKLVVHHDYYLGNPDNGNGLISQTKYSYIKTVDAGSWFKPEFKGEKIPILDNVFSLIGDFIDYELELKGATVSFLHAVLNTVKRYNLLKNVEFTSPHLPLLFKLKQIEKKAKIGMFVQEYPSWMKTDLRESLILDYLKLLNAQVAHLPLALINDRLIKKIKKNNIYVHAADCNTREQILVALNNQVDQLSTNNISLAVKLVK